MLLPDDADEDSPRVPKAVAIKIRANGLEKDILVTPRVEGVFDREDLWRKAKAIVGNAGELPNGTWKLK